MRSAITLALALVFVSGAAGAEVSECMAHCESRYKACATSGKMSPQACRAEYEKCRRDCDKKKKSTLE